MRKFQETFKAGMRYEVLFFFTKCSEFNSKIAAKWFWFLNSPYYYEDASSRQSTC